ncbi:MAG: dimethylsulfoniopropionate demethylase [Pseudomonadota bacterium]
MQNGLKMSRRIRRTPYTARVEALGVSGFTVVNHTLLPKAFQHTAEDDYWHLREHVQLWDVGCQRQVEIRGSDAGRLVQWMTPRDLSTVAVGRCVYTPLVDHRGLLVNDPITIKLGDDHFWLSIADSDVALYALGLARGADLDVSVGEADIWPIAVQGPRAEALMCTLYGDHLRNVRYFGTATVEIDGSPCTVARSGYSGQGGFELYPTPAQGRAAWDALWRAGQAFDIRPGCPNLIDRIESGLLSFGNEMTRDDSPLEAGLARWCDLDTDTGCIGLDALRAQRARGVTRSLCGVRVDAPRGAVCTEPWPVRVGGETVGSLTSAIHSPRLGAHVALGILAHSASALGHGVEVQIDADLRVRGTVEALPFTPRDEASP